MGCSGGDNTELRGNFGVPNSLGDDEAARVEETKGEATPIVEDEAVSDEEGEGRFEEETESSSRVREEVEWGRKPRRKNRCSRRKRVPLWSLLGKHGSKLQRSRTHKGKKKKSQNRITQGDGEEARAEGGYRSQ